MEEEILGEISIEFRPDGVTPISLSQIEKHKFEECAEYKNVTIQILKCNECGEYSIAWKAQPDTECIFDRDLEETIEE